MKTGLPWGDVFGGLVAANVVSFLFRDMDFEISLLTTEIAGGLY